MVTFVVFWAATFAIIFFLLGILFKALASAFNALLTSIAGIIGFGGLGVLVIIVLLLLYGIIDGIIKDGFWSVVGMIILLIIMFSFFGAIIGGLGVIVLEIAVFIAEYAIKIISYVLEWAADLCERLYAKLLKIIISQLDRY